MAYVIRKLYVAITALLLTSIGQAYGGSLTYEEGGDCCSSSPCCVRGFISADLLYWKVHEGGFACGCIPDEIDNFINEDGNVLSKFRGHTKDPHFKWDPGFRLGTGYEFGNQSWDIAAYWTHFHTHIHDHHHENQFRWKLDYDVIDVLLGRKFCADCFTFRPFIGVRAAQIKQKVKSTTVSKYNTLFCSGSSFCSCSGGYSDSSLTNFFQSEEDNKGRFRGVGPLIGIEADWHLGCGFSLYAYGAVSGLYGHYNLEFNGSSTFLNGTNICYEEGHLHHCQISTDAILGIRWEKCFCNNMQVIFQLALEQHRYFDHNHIGEHGDLCLDGFSFSGYFSF